jgi:hypothetical protein
VTWLYVSSVIAVGLGDCPRELSGESLRVQRAAVRSAEHQAVIGEPRSHQQPLGDLPLPVFPQRGDGARVECDGATTPGSCQVVR